MSRLVDESVVLSNIHNAHEWNEVRAWLKIAPTVDAVEVVRCKDCKHKHLENMVLTCPFGLPGGEDFFCGYGAEKGDGMTNELAIRILTGDVLGTSEQTHEAVTMAIKALSQPDVPDTNVGDTISRQAAIDAIQKDRETSWKDLEYDDDEYRSGCDDGYAYSMQTISELPSVERKKGKWIHHTDWEYDGECGYECSVCGMGSDVDYDFCMRCGADMRGDNDEV